MNGLSQVSDMMKKYNLNQKSSDKIDFITCYIGEAHPNDGWDLYRDSYNISIHKNIDDRIKATNVLIDEWTKISNNTISFITSTKNNKVKHGCKIIIDNMNNEIENKFCAYPDRLFIFENNKIVFAGDNGPFLYSTKLVDQFLKKKFSF